MAPYPTWPPDKMWPFALLASCHVRPPELQHVPDDLDTFTRVLRAAVEVSRG